MNLNNRQMSFSSGFTLIELMVVVFLIGLISGFAVLSINSRGNDRDIDEQLRRLQIQLGLAGEESVIQGRPIGVLFEQGHYLFLIAGKSQWSELINNKELRAQELLHGWKFELRLAGKDVPLDVKAGGDNTQAKLIPQITFFPSGEMDPFELLIVDLDNIPKYRMWYGEDGVIALEPIDES